MKPHVPIIGLAFALSACATQPPPPPRLTAIPSLSCTPPALPLVNAELMFGLPTSGLSAVTPDDFTAFVAAVITPLFPDGLTILAGQGQYRPPGTKDPEHEPSRLVQIVADATPATEVKLNQVRAAYRTRFHQRSVGLITVTSCASF